METNNQNMPLAMIVPYEEIVYMFDYRTPLDQYDLNLNKAISRLEYWKIIKK